MFTFEASNLFVESLDGHSALKVFLSVLRVLATWHNIGIALWTTQLVKHKLEVLIAVSIW